MFYTIDRFEEDFAVLIDDNKDVFSIYKSDLGKDAKVGNVYFSDDKKVFTFSPEETQKRKNKAVSLHKKLFGSIKK